MKRNQANETNTHIELRASTIDQIKQKKELKTGLLKFEIAQSEKNLKKQKKRIKMNEESLHVIWDTIK